MCAMNTVSSWFLSRLPRAPISVAECDGKASPSSSGVGFDPEALERGAKALREINNSPHAKKVLDLAKTQEVTKQQESKAKEAEMQAAASQYAVQQEKVRWEEQRKYAQEQAQHKGEIAKFEDQLARRRQEESHEKERQRNAEMVALQEQSKKRIEGEKLAIEQRQARGLGRLARPHTARGADESRTYHVMIEWSASALAYSRASDASGGVLPCC